MAADLLPVICFNMMLYPLHSLNLNILQVEGRSDLFLKLEIIKKFIAVIPLLMGIFISIYYMLWGSVIAGLFAYYLNSYYSGKLLDYSIVTQIKDILPSFGISVIMAIITYSVSILSWSPFVLLPLQLVIGASVTLVLCEWVNLAEYKELKSIALSVVQKNVNN